MREDTSDPGAINRLPDGTMVHARILTDADEPIEEWTTGPLRSLWVTTRWGSWLRHEVNAKIIDPATIEEL